MTTHADASRKYQHIIQLNTSADLVGFPFDKCLQRDRRSSLSASQHKLNLRFPQKMHVFEKYGDSDPYYTKMPSEGHNQDQRGPNCSPRLCFL